MLTVNLWTPTKRGGKRLVRTVEIPASIPYVLMGRRVWVREDIFNHEQREPGSPPCVDYHEIMPHVVKAQPAAKEST